MKVVLLLSLLILAAVVQDSEAGWLRRVGRKVRDRVRNVGTRITDGVKGVGTSIRDGVKNAGQNIRDTVKNAGQNVRDRARDAVRAGLRNIFRGKRSALTMNRLEDVNAIDLATTFNLDIPAVQYVFVDCDVNKDGALDGQEVLVFLGVIEGLMNVNNQQSTMTVQ